MRLAFAGTGRFGLPSLFALAGRGWVAAVITQPDRPAGRGLKAKASPVKEAAKSLGLPLLQPRSINSPETLNELRKLRLDLLVVAAFGQFLRREVLSLPALGCVNVHASLLPKYRGAAPIPWAILHGERETGVTTFLMDEGMDTGPILLERRVEIGEEETAGELCERLGELGAELILETVEGLVHRSLRPMPQSEGGTLAPKLKRGDGHIDWSWPSARVHNWIRGMNPWPGAHTTFRKNSLKLHRSRRTTLPNPGLEPGTILPAKGKLLVAAGEGVLELLEVQPAGKKRMSGRDFWNGYLPKPGERFNAPSRR